MNKKGGEGGLGNLIENYKSLTKKYDENEKSKESPQGKTSSVIPLQISEARLKWLIDKEKLQGQNKSDSYFIGSGSVGKLSIDFLLVKDKNSATWRVYYDAGKLYGLGEKEKPASSNYNKAKDNFFGREEVKREMPKSKQEDPDKYFKTFWDKLVAESEKWQLKDPINGKTYNHYVPALAITNPHLEYDLNTSEGYKNAVTGDYDLFAVWPKVADKALDSRVAGMTAKTTNEDITSAEDNSKIGKVVGNISERVFLIAQMLNSVMGKGVKSVNRVFHSDEGGRPFLDGVDEAAVFTPDGKIFMVSPDKNKHASQLSSLIRTCKKEGYTIFANVAWMNFLDDDVKNMVTWSEAVSEIAKVSPTKK
jgi:hypothetical protein